MKLIICDAFKINTYQLPEKIEDFYIINDTFGKDLLKETIYLDGYQNTWSIKADETIQITSNNEIVQMAVLEDYASYHLKFSDLDNILYLYVVPDFEFYFSLRLTEQSITIGNTKEDTICYLISDIIPSNITINFVNNCYIITENGKNSNLYINSKKVKQKVLELGDVIFFFGLKIIFMDTYVKLNNPKESVSSYSLPNMVEEAINNNYTPPTDFEKNVKLYKENQLFFHTPRLKSEIEEENIVIDTPPEEEKDEQMPLLLTVGSSAVIGITSCITGISALNGLMTGTISMFNAILEFSMCILMLISCILFPILIDLWQKKRIKKKEKLRQERYKEYLQKKQETILEIMKKQEQILYENNYSLKEIETAIVNRRNSIWSREIIDNDFLSIRLGIGDTPCSIKIDAIPEQFSLYDDNLRDEVVKMTKEKRMIKNVPIVFSLLQNRVTPFIINFNFRKQYIESILLQLLFYYSGLDLKIVFFTNELGEEEFEYLKYMPHCFSKDRERRFFASNENEMVQMSIYLEQEYERRLKESANLEQKEKDSQNDMEHPYKNFDEYYLLITDDFKVVKGLPIIDRIINSNVDFGFSLLIFETSLKNLPSRLKKFISIENQTSGIFERTLDINKQTQFQPEYQNDLNMMAYTKILANIPLAAKNEKQRIPLILPFLEMYKVGRVDQLNVLTRWKENDPTISLKAPIGQKEYEKILELDLHEKYHGPHGLIAGSTGSGKSEFIMSYILSMAINYDPREVQFILIDYKGGGLALAFENRETGVKIPHLVGTITNLDNNEMHRTLVSIQSELKRRQRKFNEARNFLGEGTIDIYKYQSLYREGKVKEPISHLFVISDEFAELKQQQPDFMDELISTARIGRSLGVHLILATQKPSGVVDDQIWSNSRFHVCLKVQTSEDSVEMLKKADAANIKEVGRFYLQVGNDEIFEFGQSAWCGAKYNPVNRIIKKVNDDIEFISNDGTVLKRINDTIKQSETVEMGEQLANIVKYLYDIAIKEKISFQSLWLPSIPKNIYLGNLIKKYQVVPSKEKIEVIIGEYDKPEKQEQGLCKIDLTCKNTIIFGLPNSGKENLLTTLIYFSCIYYHPKVLSFYIIDFGSESLRVFRKMPHVGDMMITGDQEKIKAYFEYLEQEIKKRKELFTDYSGDYINYCKNSGSFVPLIVTVLNGYESFMENCMENSDIFMRLLRDGSKYGIIFVMSVISTNSVRNNVLECFTNKILLQVADEFDYRYIINAPTGLIPKKEFSRGLTIVEEEACEFQTAYITNKDNINTLIKDSSKTLMEKYQYKVKEVKIFPRIVTFNMLQPYAKMISKIPIGISKEEVEIAYYDFSKQKFNLILGKNIIEDLNFMCNIINLIDSVKEVHLNILDFLSCIRTDGTTNYYNIDFKTPLKEIVNNKQGITVNILLGFGNFSNVMSSDEIELIDQIFSNKEYDPKQIFIIIDNYNRFCELKTQNWYNNIDKSSGIWYGQKIDEQDIFTINNLKDYDIEDDMIDITYIINNGNYLVVKGIGAEREEII